MDLDYHFYCTYLAASDAGLNHQHARHLGAISSVTDVCDQESAYRKKIQLYGNDGHGTVERDQYVR